MPERQARLTITELAALAVFVQAGSATQEVVDKERLANGLAVAYGDSPPNGYKELQAELKARRILE